MQIVYKSHKLVGTGVVKMDGDNVSITVIANGQQKVTAVLKYVDSQGETIIDCETKQTISGPAPFRLKDRNLYYDVSGTEGFLMLCEIAD